MSALGFGERLTVRRLHNTIHRNLFRQQRARYESSKPNQGQRNASTVAGGEGASSPRPQTIPVAGWSWSFTPVLEPFRAFGRMQRRSPYMTQFSTSLTIYFLGDLSAQSVASRGFEGDQQYEPIRGLRAMVIGGIMSIPSYRWFLWLGRNFNYSSWIRTMGTKILISQTLFTPIFNTYFFSMQTFLTGGNFADAKQRVIDTVPVSWKNSWKLWPAVTAFSFTFIPEQYRNIFAGVIAIGWQTYLSWVNQRAEEREKELNLLKAQ
ncbi:Mpv17/PMP22 family protein [Polychaeton citri CBS 116435]|uniref:Mpv17/PMP22 family protein n=1 Tax=Polychaeton citri CBS 116435 TaxID=1314669 RepID=A0A9P4UTQ1_9PEZI|nr:Mpv17/PMP22 family protein [Polychaeton citri CBS 116435]